jgi:hypothetical protein
VDNIPRFGYRDLKEKDPVDLAASSGINTQGGNRDAASGKISKISKCFIEAKKEFF